MKKLKKTERKRGRTTAVTSLALRTHDCGDSWLGVVASCSSRACVSVASASIAVASASRACVSVASRFCSDSIFPSSSPTVIEKREKVGICFW
ncbi:hypothetical protein MTR_0372s0030 [Medicago truncatula]|uniref:Uncharacterized protein n=1 Tax=Medicago truncatula TaxID=3880 RepID=A0A072TR39_MEDTR|nr:hypothetical protein MTR_0372s0030 [Medicago truncatula]